MIWPFKRWKLEPWAEALISDMRENPMSWSMNRFWAKGDKCAVWIGNEDYGIEIYSQDELTASSFRPDSRTRTVIFAAVQEIKKAQALQWLSGGKP